MRLTWPAPNRSVGFLDGLGAMGLLGLLVARFIPLAVIIPGWGCALRRTTGIPCLGCGLTRAADHFSHGHFALAFDANPLGAVAAGLFALAAVWSALHLAFKVPTPALQLSPREGRWARNGVIALVLLNYAFVIVRTRFPGVL
ncbi:MAG: DUF2752 domain-containing protein [Myxococcaceae bacterium]